MRQDRPRIVLTIPELTAALGLVVWGLGTFAYVLAGAAFFLWVLALALLASPFVVVSMRRRRRRLERRRAIRRSLRASHYADPWLEWEEAA